MTDQSPDANALAGLRRLVLHSRDLLQACPAEETGIASTRAPDQVQRLVASSLAVQVLTLVADCLPDPAGVPHVVPDGDKR